MTIHRTLNPETWQTQPLTVQLANVGAEVQRLLNWRAKGNAEQVEKSLHRALELLDWTLVGATVERQRELLRLREITCDTAVRSDLYQVSAEQLIGYFLPFAVRARTASQA